MAEIVRMPKLSDTMTEALQNGIKEGDNIESGDLLADIETDKATMGLNPSKKVCCYTLVWKKVRLLQLIQY